jgi:hypothetical protein
MKTEYKYSKKIVEKLEKFDMPVVQLTDFLITNSEDKHIFMDGAYFPMRYGSHHGQIIYDYIGSYFQLKEMYPDLKMVFFKSKFREDFEPFSKDFIDLCNIEVLDIYSNNYLFKSVVFGPNEWSPIDLDVHRSIFDPTYEEMCDTTMQWRLESTKLFVEHFKEKLTKDSRKQKSYITRTFFNKKYLDSSDTWSGFRVHDKAYDESLDQEFLDNGYNLVEFTGKRFLDQANIAYNSSIFATIEGSAFWNAIWCDPDTKMLSIRTNKKYIDYGYYWKETLAAVNNLNYIELDVSGLSPELGMEKIKSWIKDNE